MKKINATNPIKKASKSQDKQRPMAVPVFEHLVSKELSVLFDCLSISWIERIWKL